VQALANDLSTPWLQTNSPCGGIVNTIEIDPDYHDILYTAVGAGAGVCKTGTSPMTPRNDA